MKYNVTVATTMLVEPIKILKKVYNSTQNDITKALNSNTTNISFDSPLSSHIFDNPSHKMLFAETSLASNDLGIKQVVQEAIEIKIRISINIS